ncbi:MAG: LPS export ABC transporter permease LptG [Desulfobacula sp.]|jgi:lipopolysaccharide export system permease protein|uniref:LPS export ABC transporter permease LptG n=1 Tax=Desulfobacula sp. TaxID=2593537 RepID=UPI001DAFD625|nr:LPS export ABC transporter permease LptG [Desulfobacula sp.]MBT3484491.1 LPS export ABC transporter permease LptG [Desulfobacula sp.]MBT3803129.1 LPS export ABC transporter permease LptG [Desulfobacula sp.]MBT4024699.1 LPS export ABC transporter permease LptG [Desulfobacula sp.]MBT4197177.1 LPS export ABC transporter permease LptG [Desulfobacula sp.]
MSCLHKYWLKEFFKFFSIIQLMILVLFVIIDYLSRMDKFLNSDISLLGAFGYVLLKVPFMFVQLTPAGILLSIIIVFGLMNRNNELLAIRSSGISIYFLIKPAILVSAVLAVLMFFLGETIIPISMAKANFIKYNVIKKNKNYLSARKDIWVKSENRLIHINFFDPAKQSIAGITITSLRKNFSLESRIDAEKGYFEKGKWVFENIIEQIHVEDSMDYDVNLYDKKHIPLEFKPEDFGEVLKKSDEMSFFELKKYVNKVEDEGYDSTTYRVDLNGKIAFPFICIIMALTGAATGMRSFVKENIPAAIAIGVMIAFMYWVMYGLCLSMGYGTFLPPVISAWTANMFFLCFGTLYLINTE